MESLQDTPTAGIVCAAARSWSTASAGRWNLAHQHGGKAAPADDDQASGEPACGRDAVGRVVGVDAARVGAAETAPCVLGRVEASAEQVGRGGDFGVGWQGTGRAAGQSWMPATGGADGEPVRIAGVSGVGEQHGERSASAAGGGGAGGKVEVLVHGAGDGLVGRGCTRGAAGSTDVDAGCEADAEQAGGGSVGDVGRGGERAGQAAADSGEGGGPDETERAEAGAYRVACAGVREPGDESGVHQGGCADEKPAGGDGVGDVGLEGAGAAADGWGGEEGGCALEEQRAVGRLADVGERDGSGVAGAGAVRAGSEAGVDAVDGVRMAGMGVERERAAETACAVQACWAADGEQGCGLCFACMVRMDQESEEGGCGSGVGEEQGAALWADEVGGGGQRGEQGAAGVRSSGWADEEPEHGCGDGAVGAGGQGGGDEQEDADQGGGADGEQEACGGAGVVA